MSFFPTLPETQAALAVSILAGTLVYEDGATVLAATLSASGRLDPVLGLLAAFVGIWTGDIGLYALGSTFGRYTAKSERLRKFLKPEPLARAQTWFTRHGCMALVMSRAIPGSRLPLYLAAGALQLPLR
jgi:membrane protein DedA with SNARE-associated domain